MGKKITRRVVLGTAIAGLAVGPFFIKALRNPRNLDGGLVELAKSLEKESGMPLSGILQSVDWFMSERDRWIGLREMSAVASFRVTVQVSGVGEVSLSVEEPLTLRLVGVSRDDRKPFSFVRDGEYPFTYVAESKKEPAWKMEIDAGVEDYRYAKMTNCSVDVERCVPVVLQMLRTPLEFFWSFARTDEEGILNWEVPCAWEGGGTTSTVAFRSEDGRKLFLDHGRFAGREGKASTLRVREYENVDGWEFPSFCELSHVADDTKSSNSTLRLTNISLRTDHSS